MGILLGMIVAGALNTQAAVGLDRSPSAADPYEARCGGEISPHDVAYCRSERSLRAAAGTECRAHCISEHYACEHAGNGIAKISEADGPRAVEYIEWCEGVWGTTKGTMDDILPYCDGVCSKGWY